MRSSVPQLAPRLLPSDSHRVTGVPPSTGTFFSLSSAMKAIHFPSGEKIGVLAPSVPGIAVRTGALSFLTYSIFSWLLCKVSARVLPSGDNAITPI